MFSYRLFQPLLIIRAKKGGYDDTEPTDNPVQKFDQHITQKNRRPHSRRRQLEVFLTLFYHNNLLPFNMPFLHLAPQFSVADRIE